MLRLAKELKGFTLEGRDGEIGNVREFYFDDKSWTIRYLIANTGSWMTGRSVLISPYALSKIFVKERLIRVELTKAQIENSPAIDTDKPVSRQFELAYYPFYGLPPYWGGSSAWDDAVYPQMIESPPGGVRGRSDEIRQGDKEDPHLRSTKDVDGHTIQALDGQVGHVEDFVVDDESWTIQYLIVATRDWWPGKKVLIATRSIDRISWEESRVYLRLKRETIQKSPEYSEGVLILPRL